MRDFHLRFCFEDIENLFGKKRGGWFDTKDGLETFNLLEDKVLDIPDESGAYVLGTADGTMLVYPWGTSPIYYIGMASSIRTRLSSHRNFTEKAIKDHTENWWPQYQYGAAFGTSCVWYLSKEKDPKNVETTLIDSFYQTYGAIPVANRSWPNYRDEDE